MCGEDLILVCLIPQSLRSDFYVLVLNEYIGNYPQNWDRNVALFEGYDLVPACTL
jgi:hypothetical protein